jgi:hypothetical protein
MFLDGLPSRFVLILGSDDLSRPFDEDERGNDRREPYPAGFVSFAHLNRLDCISADVGGPGAKVEPAMRPFGTLLMNVVSD